MLNKHKNSKEIPVNNLEESIIPDNDESSEGSTGNEIEVKPGDFSSLDKCDLPPEADTALKEEIEADEKLIQDEIDRLTELWQRERANFINYKRRVEEEKSNIRKYALYDIACGLINVLDYFESSISFGENLPEDARNVILGVEYTLEELKRVLSTHGVLPIEVEIGDQYDSSLMEAVQRRTDAGTEPGGVIAVQRRGWKLHDRVLRAAQVVVAAAPETEVNN